MKKSVNENINRLRSLMGLLKEDSEDTKTGEENDEIQYPTYGPNAIYAKIPCNYKNGKNAFQLQSNEDYSFNDGYTYYLLPSKFENGSDPQMNPNVFNYGESTNDGRTVIAGTYTLLKVKDNSEIFEGKPFNAKRPPTGGPLKPETGSWTELIDDAKSWTIDLFLEGKDSTLKSIYSDTSNFLNPTTKVLTYQDVEPTGWVLTDVGNISNVDRFKNIPEVTTSTNYMLDIISDGKITFFIRQPRLARLIPIWDGKQLTFKKSNGSEKSGEIIVTSSNDISKVEESKLKYKKTLLFEKSEKTGCIEGDCKNGYGTFISSDGDKYVGNWKDGSKNGYGTETYSLDGSEKYVGNWKNGFYSGYGTYTWSDGSKHVGKWKSGSMNGYGTKTYSDGRKYVGNWKDSEQSGYGTYIDIYGDKYVGNFKDSDYDGYGTKTYSDGRKYVGNWKDGEHSGYGTYTWKNGSKYVGNWKDGKYHGYGTHTNPSGCKFSGEWNKWILNGKDALEYDDITNCTEKPKEKTKEKPKENEVNNVEALEQKPTKFELVADDIFSNLIQGKIPKVTMVSYTEPILDKDGHYDYVYLKAKINNIVYDLNFSPLGLNIQDSAGNHKKAVWDNKNLTVRNFTKEEKKDAEEDYRLLSDIQLLGGDKFVMEETLKRFKQLIK
jgi:hypothetical protein